MIAKYPGVCRKCGQRFQAGTDITFSKEEGANHVTCPPRGEGAAVPPAPDAAPARRSNLEERLASIEARLTALESALRAQGGPDAG